MHKYAFIVGCPRSATTEFTRLLNSHDKIFIGIERYVYLYSRLRKLGSAIAFDVTRFEPKNFNEIREGETFFGRIEDMPGWISGFYGGRGGVEKIGDALVVGDKAPVGLFCVENIASRIAGSKFLIVIRDIISVSRSWQKRADDTQDVLWPSSNGFSAAASQWISYLQNGILLRRSNIPILEVYSPNLYKDNDTQVDAVLRFLEIEPDVEIRKTLETRRRLVMSRNFRSTPTAEEKKIVLSHIERIRRLAVTWKEHEHPCQLEDLFWDGMLRDIGME